MHEGEERSENNSENEEFAGKEEERLKHVEKLQRSMVGYQLKLYSEGLSKRKKQRLARVDERQMP